MSAAINTNKPDPFSYSEAARHLAPFSYIPPQVDRGIAELARGRYLGLVGGLGTSVFSFQMATKNIQQITSKSGWGSLKKLFTVLKAHAYVQMFINGLAMIADAVGDLSQKAKSLLQPLINYGPIAGIIAAATLAFFDAKDLYFLLKADEKNWDKIKTKAFSLISNLCMLVAPIIFLTLMASNPYTAVILILILGILSSISYVGREWEWFTTHPRLGLLVIILIAGFFTISYA